jgi:hypothetical protein
MLYRRRELVVEHGLLFQRQKSTDLADVAPPAVIPKWKADKKCGRARSGRRLSIWALRSGIARG